jgi:Kazal-type serine protease inhibitor domain
MTLRNRAQGRAILSTALMLLGACATEELTLAKRNGPPLGAGVCTNASECAASELCTKASCGEAFGFCEKRPTVCSGDFLPVCGCDGISYFNDCLRAANGTSLGAQMACGPGALRCGGRDRTACPPEAYCAKIFARGPACARDESGECWVLPSRCNPSQQGGDLWRACMPTGAPPEEQCVDTCAAIRSERPYQRASRCP